MTKKVLRNLDCTKGSDKRQEPADLPEFFAQQGLGFTSSLTQVLEIKTADEFLWIFQGAAIMRARRGGLACNAAIVSASTHDVSLFLLLTSLARTDSSPSCGATPCGRVRRPPVTRGLAAIHQVEAALSKANEDSDAAVREECAMIRSRLRKFA